MNRKLARTLGALALVALTGAAAATALTVGQRADVAALFAERVDIPQSLAVDGARILPAPDALGALGSAAVPVEMGAAHPDARTAVARDHWTYAVGVKESSAGAIQRGLFAVTLLLDGVSVGTVHLAQESADPDAVEGARVAFDLGPDLRPNALYVVEIRPVVQEGPVVAVTVASSADGPSWVGVGGEADGQTNPGIAVPLGATLRLTARNGDSGLHNVGIKGGSALVDPPGWSPDIETVGAEATLAWAPSAAGTYTYQCRYHPSMTGEIVVTA